MSNSMSENALKRRLKKHFPKKDLSIFVPCPMGMVSLAKQDLSHLNLKINCVENEGLEIKGDWQTVYALNLHSRVGNRVLVRMTEFYIGSYPELFQKLKRIHWEVFMGSHSTYSLKITAKKSRLHHTGNIAKTFEESIGNSMKSLGVDVSSSDDSSIRFYIRIFQDRCQISIDTTGEHLHKRGYRRYVGKAPMRENLVSGLLQLSGELPDVLVDPFCSSGTIAFEYIFLKWQQAPGLDRKFFFEEFSYFQKKRWEDLRQSAKERIKKSPVKVLLNDIDAEVVRELKKEIEGLCLSDYISVENKDYVEFLKNLSQPSSLPGDFIFISNLPYGKRISAETNDVFSEINKALSGLQKKPRYGLMIERSMLKSYEDAFGARSQEKSVKSLKFKNGGLNTLFLIRNSD